METPSLHLIKSESKTCIEMYATEMIANKTEIFEMSLQFYNEKFSSTSLNLRTELPFIINNPSKEIILLQAKRKLEVN